MLSPRRGADLFSDRSLTCRAHRGRVKLEPMSRRRPLSSTRAGGVELRSRCAHRSSTRAGPFDAVIDVVRSRRLEAAYGSTSSSGAWFSARPFSPLPSSFASSPCCPPSLSEWRSRESARGDREHCLRITTARQKNQRFRIMQHARTRIDTRCCVSTGAADARDSSRGAIEKAAARETPTARKYR